MIVILISIIYRLLSSWMSILLVLIWSKSSRSICTNFHERSSEVDGSAHSPTSCQQDLELFEVIDAFGLFGLFFFFFLVVFLAKLQETATGTPWNPAWSTGGRWSELGFAQTWGDGDRRENRKHPQCGHSCHSLWPWNAMEIDKALGLTDLHRDHKQLNPTFISYCWTTWLPIPWHIFNMSRWGTSKSWHWKVEKSLEFSVPALPHVEYYRISTTQYFFLA